MSFSIRLSAEEKSLAESYAKLQSMSLGEAFKKALFDEMPPHTRDFSRELGGRFS